METTAASRFNTEVAFEERTYGKVTRRLIPFLFLCYLCAYIDRVNVGFAKLQMLNDLHFSETMYGLGAGIFFLGYFLFEVPSNVLLHRVGARRWIARIMITWAVLSAANAFVTTPTSFYVVRFLLGVAEAGFFPGVILYLTYWYPARRRAKTTALFMTAIPASGILGGPLSGWILKSFEGTGAWTGWQWLFVLEAVPSLIVGIVVLFYLEDRVDQARWLTEDEKRLLQENVRREQGEKTKVSLRSAMTHGRVWFLAIVYFMISMGNYAINFWLPSLIRAAGVKDVLDIGLLSAIPFGFGAISMVLFARSADKHGERRWHLVIAMLIGAVGLLLSASQSANIAMAMGALSFACVGILALGPLFWSLPTAFLGGVGAAAGIALINSLGNLAGFASPYLLGWIKDQTQSTALGVVVIAVCLVLGAALLAIGVPQRVASKAATA